MGSWWRSEDMTFVSLILSEEVDNINNITSNTITNTNNTIHIIRLLLVVLEN
jgi:hypothetical protein